ncbi:hypothetical protein FRB99_001676 [Tulasnella sp. 403]|nr:hypothetical protein FRB99_001676 [Tulasnella sp. 403]
MAPAPARGMASMPSSPTGEGSTKTIAAGAFKKFRAPGTPSPGLAPASGTPSPEQSPGSFTIRKRAPPLVAEPSYGSTGSGATNFASAPTSPIGDRGAPLPGRSSLEGRPSGTGGYTPSPLSLPVDAASSESSHSIPIGLGTSPLQPPLPGHGSDFSRVSYLSAAPGSPLEGDPSMIGVAVGSPSGEYTSGATAHRLTIGDAGWKPGMPARYAQNPSDASGYFPPPDGEDRGLHPGHGRYGAGM